MKSTAKDWDEVRSAFAASIMVDTSIDSLAQNLDVPEWPIKSREDTPARYVDYTFDEAVRFLNRKGQPPERLDDLVVILRETLAFDTPFGDMIEQGETASKLENPVLKNMAKLGIPENFPMELTSLGSDALEFCKLEHLTTLGEFAVASQNMSQNVIVGGDFRKLLNALSHVDEQALAEVLPFRAGHKGLHLVEAMAQAARGTDGPAKAALVTTWFRDDLAAMEKDVAAGGTIARHFVRIGNPELEKRAAALLKPHFRGAVPGRKRAGWLSWFRKSS